MYVVTIAKLSGPENKTWAGFNMMSQFLLLGDLEKECQSYGIEFQPCEKGELVVLETDWNHFHVMIQYRRIS